MINEKKIRRSKRQLKRWNNQFSYRFRHRQQAGDSEPHTFMGIPLHIKPSKPLHDPAKSNKERMKERRDDSNR